MIINFVQCSSMPILSMLNYFFTGCRIKACRVKAAKNIKGAAFIWLPAFTPEPPGLMLRWHGSRSGALYYLMLEIVFLCSSKSSRDLSPTPRDVTLMQCPHQESFNLHSTQLLASWLSFINFLERLSTFFFAPCSSLV